MWIGMSVKYSSGHDAAHNCQHMPIGIALKTWIIRLKLQRSIEQCYATKFSIKLIKSGNETLKILKNTYKDKILS